MREPLRSNDRKQTKRTKPARDGWAEAARKLAAEGGDELVTGEHGDEADELAKPDDRVRDPRRIDEVLHAIKRVWELNPDLRFGQLVVNAIRPAQPCPGVFYAEDDEVLKALKAQSGEGGPAGSGALQLSNCDLVVMDAGPLSKLAVADRLDLLLRFNRQVHIPDEVEFEAVEKHAWEHQSPLREDKLRLRAWIEQQAAAGRVSRASTLVGEGAGKKRASGEWAPSKRNHRQNTGELAAHDFLNNRAEVEGLEGKPLLLLVDDRPGLEKLQQLLDLDAYVLSIGMLMAPAHLFGRPRELVRNR